MVLNGLFVLNISLLANILKETLDVQIITNFSNFMETLSYYFIKDISYFSFNPPLKKL